MGNVGHIDPMVENPYRGPDSEDLNTPPTRPTSPRGIVLKIMAVLGIVSLVVLLLLPAVRTARPAARRIACANKLKQIAIALHSYADACGTFPPAYTVDADGKALHSWRTLILPWLEQKALYDSIDLTKPWDDPVNTKARETAVSEYQCPSTMDLGNHTTYLAVVTNGSCMRFGHSCSLAEVTDGLSTTLLVIDVDMAHAVPWMSPVDADEQVILSIDTESELQHPGGFQAAFADAHVRFLEADLSAPQRRALISISGHDDAALDDEE